MSRLKIFILGVISLLLVLPVGVYSISNDQINLHASGINWFNLEGATGITICGVGGDTVLIGENNHERAFNYLLGRGLTDFQAAGIVGNLIHESNVDPQRRQGAGYQTISSPDEIVPNVGFGIAQWTPEGRQNRWLAFAEENNADPLSLELQLDFLWHELTTNSGLGLDELLVTTTTQQATWIFLAFYERPRSVIEGGYVVNPNIPPPGNSARRSLDARTEYAEEVLLLYGGANLGFSGSCTLNTSEPDFAATGVRIDGSPPWIGNPGNCAPGFTDGAQILKDFIEEVWSPPVEGVGGYNCRHINGNENLTSIHGMGRALDIYIDAYDPYELQVGNEIRNWLINNSVAIGVQRVIWNRGVWSSNQDGWRDYCPGGAAGTGGCDGKHDHKNHIHAEINEDGANLLTSWFQ